jgi:RimJ/RimL family protein N-acetyltransferase
MKRQEDSSIPMRQNREQMLKLIAKSFYKELIAYGVNTHEILSVTEHLLDTLQHKPCRQDGDTEYYNRLFVIGDVRDDWDTAKRLTVQEVCISPMKLDVVPQVVTWLQAPEIRETFYPCFPDSEESLVRYFQTSDREYFSIFYQEELSGIIGAENLDIESAKLEMRKLVGDPRMHGKGIGKQATFLFLYYVFVIRKFKKVYLNTMDINIRNINLNCKFGFELEGVFLEDAVIQNKWRDVVRMALYGPTWLALFSRSDTAHLQDTAAPPYRSVVAPIYY